MKCVQPGFSALMKLTPMLPMASTKGVEERKYVSSWKMLPFGASLCLGVAITDALIVKYLRDTGLLC